MVKDLMEQEESVAVLQAPVDLAAVTDIHMGKAKALPTLPLITQRPLFKWVDITEEVAPGVNKVAANKQMLGAVAQVQ
jgi:hypothetical protein